MPPHGVMSNVGLTPKLPKTPVWQTDDAHAKALVGRLVLACRRPLNESALLEEIVSADGQVLPLSGIEWAAVKAVLGTEAVPAPTTPPAEPRVAPLPSWISNRISRQPTPSAAMAAAIGAVPPAQAPVPASAEQPPSQKGVLEFLNSGQASPATLHGTVARTNKALKFPAANAKQWLIPGGLGSHRVRPTFGIRP